MGPPEADCPRDSYQQILVGAVKEETVMQIDIRPLRFGWALTRAALVLVPFAYFGLLFAVAVHEVIGHGLMSLAVGGEFLGFQLDFDGMGYALIPLATGTETWQQILVLSGGVVATSILGACLLSCAYVFRRRPWVSLPMVVVSFDLLLEGIPYVFWNALKPVPPGDIGMILTMTDSIWLRVVLIALGGALMVAVVWGLTALFYVILESWLSDGRGLRGKARVLLLAMLGVVPAMSWFVFDWNQLTPGIGATPNIVGALLHVLAAASLLWISPRVLQLRSDRGAGLAAIVGWSLAAVSIAATAMWFRDGVVFFDSP